MTKTSTKTAWIQLSQVMVENRGGGDHRLTGGDLNRKTRQEGHDLTVLVTHPGIVRDSSYPIAPPFITSSWTCTRLSKR
jgi:hypothetical protein